MVKILDFVQKLEGNSQTGNKVMNKSVHPGNLTSCQKTTTTSSSPVAESTAGVELTIL